jgi:hypothetical protein
VSDLPKSAWAPGKFVLIGRDMMPGRLHGVHRLVPPASREIGCCAGSC